MAGYMGLLSVSLGRVDLVCVTATPLSWGGEEWLTEGRYMHVDGTQSEIEESSEGEGRE